MLEYVVFAPDDILVGFVEETTNVKLLVGEVPPIYVPAIETVSPTAKLFPPSVRTIEVDKGCPVEIEYDINTLNVDIPTPFVPLT